MYYAPNHDRLGALFSMVRVHMTKSVGIRLVMEHLRFVAHKEDKDATDYSCDF